MVVCMCVLTVSHTHTHTMEYYSAIQNNESLSFVGIWMDLEGIMLNARSQRKTNTVYVTYMWNLKSTI